MEQVAVMLRGCCHRVWTRLCDLRRGLWAPAKNGRRSVVSCIDRKTRPGVKGPSTWPALAALGPRVSPLERPSRLPVPDSARPGGAGFFLLSRLGVSGTGDTWRLPRSSWSMLARNCSYCP